MPSDRMGKQKPKRQTTDGTIRRFSPRVSFLPKSISVNTPFSSAGITRHKRSRNPIYYDPATSSAIGASTHHRRSINTFCMKTTTVSTISTPLTTVAWFVDLGGSCPGYHSGPTTKLTASGIITISTGTIVEDSLVFTRVACIDKRYCQTHTCGYC